MSGYSPTWTSKGSDKLRALQITKILLNSLEKVILSVDSKQNETKEILTTAIADSIYSYFTPNRDLEIYKQFEIMLEYFGWKMIAIESTSEEQSVIKLGANRFIEDEVGNVAYEIMVAGIAKAYGYFAFESNVIVDLVPSQFDSTQLQIVVQKIGENIPGVSEQLIEMDTSAMEENRTTPTTTKAEVQQIKTQTAKKPLLSEETEELKPTIEIGMETIFSPILSKFPISSIAPVFHKVLAEICVSFFAEMEDNNVRRAKESFQEKHVLYLLEFILISARETEQDIGEIAGMIGQYITKTLLSQTEEDITTYLPNEITSTISRRVSYVEFPARGYCTYAPGEKCITGKRDLCDLVLNVWQGILVEMQKDKKFKLGDRIPATRRGKFCLAEFLKED